MTLPNSQPSLSSADLDRSIMRRALDTAINGYAVSDIHGSLVYVNHSFLTMWGYTPDDEVLGRSVFDFWVSAEECGPVVASVRNAGAWMGELEGRKKDGTTFVAQVSASLVHNDEGVPIAMLSSFLDVTESRRIRRELNATLLHSERMAGTMRSLFNASEAVLASVEFNSTARVLLLESLKLIQAEIGIISLFDGTEELSEILYDKADGSGGGVLTMPGQRLQTMLTGLCPGGSVWMSNDIGQTPLAALLPVGHRELRNLILAPLIMNSTIAGILGVANHDGGFDTIDTETISSFAGLASIALKSEQTQEALRDSVSHYRSLFENALVGIARVSLEGQLLDLNDSFACMLGYKDAHELMATQTRVSTYYVDIADRDHLLDLIRTQGFAPPREIRFRRKDGGDLWALYGASLERGAVNPSIAVYCIDITGRKQVEDSNKALVRELYHRTKNNMNVISAMIGLQLMQTPDPSQRPMMLDLQNRIAAMSLVHQMLYRSADLSRLDFAAYVRELVAQTVQSFASDCPDVHFELELEPFTMLMDFVVPCGLILNELLTNSIKHACHPGATPVVHISVRRLPDGTIGLDYRDNGPGYGNVDPDTATTMGLTAVRLLAVHQLQGTIRFGCASDDEASVAGVLPRGGASCSVRFQDDHYEERV